MIQRLRGEKGFTLIELMIVIAIIGILAAIAIPNFIAYRDKAYCSAAEADASNIAAAIADYFSNPENISVPSDPADLGITLTGKDDNINTGTIASGATTDPIIITVVDGSGRCPRDTTDNNYILTLGSASGIW